MLKQLQPFDPGCLEESELSLNHQSFIHLCSWSRALGFGERLQTKTVWNPT